MGVRSMVDLWPSDIGDWDPARSGNGSPVGILREQAALLAEKTEATVGAEVRFDEPARMGFVYSLWMVPSTAPKRAYMLLRVMHGATTYPCHVFVGRELLQELEAACGHSPGDEPAEGVGRPLVHKGDFVVARSKDEYVQCLRMIFAASATREVVHTLMAQAEEARGGKAFVAKGRRQSGGVGG